MPISKELESFKEKDHYRLLLNGKHGLEKESLRIQPDGRLALTPHPSGLGSPLTSPNITTDFSESQIEFITAPHQKIEDSLEELHDLHKQVTKELNGEWLWPFSMPCILPEYDQIPIAQYGDSPEGKKRRTYREGLAHRYGKYMQTVCGVHYNVSFSEECWDFLIEKENFKGDRQSFINEKSLGLVRNFVRYRPVLTALFGASPVLHESYKCKVMHAHDELCHALSLRLSRCGYTNPAKIQIDYNSFEAHVQSIQKATQTSNPAYEGAGLNSNLLQLPNEYYFPIRIKPIMGEAQYIEVRLYDINPYSPVGVSSEQLYFSHLLLNYCLLKKSPPITQEEIDHISCKQEKLALCGRKDPLQYKDEFLALMEHMHELAEVMDRGFEGNPYQNALRLMEERVSRPETLLSVQMMNDIDDHEGDFIDYGLSKAKEYYDYFSA